MEQFTNNEIVEACKRSNIQFKRCDHCNELFAETKHGSRFCSTNCRVLNHRFWKNRQYFIKFITKKFKLLSDYKGFYLQRGFKIDRKEQFIVDLNGGQMLFKGDAKEIMEAVDNYIKNKNNEQ